MHRFFLPAECFREGRIVFPAGTSHQLFHVLRMKPGQRVIVLDNLGHQFETELDRVSAAESSGAIITQAPSEGEPRAWLTLFLCLTQREKFEWILQKCTEIGVSSFVPVISSRALVQDSGEVGKKLERWKKVISEAAEQSRRGRLPEITAAMSFSEACTTAGKENHLALIPWEDAYRAQGRRTFHQLLAEKGLLASERFDSPRIGMLIGPEGGFSLEEVELAQTCGIVPVSLGPRILRVETAAIVAAALALYETGDMV